MGRNAMETLDAEQRLRVLGGRNLFADPPRAQQTQFKTWEGRRCSLLTPGRRDNRRAPPMITISNLGESYGARTLFEGVCLKLSAKSRHGLVGSNGWGKTTLLRIVVGNAPPSDGSVSIASRARVGVLPRDPFLDDQDIIVHGTMKGDRLVWDALEELSQLEKQTHVDGDRVAQPEDTTATRYPHQISEEQAGRQHSASIANLKQQYYFRVIGVPNAMRSRLTRSIESAVSVHFSRKTDSTPIVTNMPQQC